MGAGRAADSRGAVRPAGSPNDGAARPEDEEPGDAGLEGDRRVSGRLGCEGRCSGVRTAGALPGRRSTSRLGDEGRPTEGLEPPEGGRTTVGEDGRDGGVTVGGRVTDGAVGRDGGFTTGDEG